MSAGFEVLFNRYTRPSLETNKPRLVAKRINMKAFWKSYKIDMGIDMSMQDWLYQQRLAERIGFFQKNRFSEVACWQKQ